MANTLFLRLEGPLQSWGERGRWSVRDTAPEPTKSGIVGLLACALGEADDAAIRALSKSLWLGVRVDEPGVLMTDYHTIGGGYDAPALLTAEGKPKFSSSRPHTEISQRDYLCGASFLAALQSTDASLIDRLAAAVQNPVWVYFLGRKSCPPSRPVYVAVGDYPDLEAALAAHDWPDNRETRHAVVECAPGETDAIARRDQFVSRRFRQFEPRYRRSVQLRFTPPKEKAS